MANERSVFFSPLSSLVSSNRTIGRDYNRNRNRAIAIVRLQSPRLMCIYVYAYICICIYIYIYNRACNWPAIGLRLNRTIGPHDWPAIGR